MTIKHDYTQQQHKNLHNNTRILLTYAESTLRNKAVAAENLINAKNSRSR